MGTKIPPKSTHLRNLFPALKPFCQSRSLLSNYFEAPERRQMVEYHQNLKSLTADCCLEVVDDKPANAPARHGVSANAPVRHGESTLDKPANAPARHGVSANAPVRHGESTLDIKEKQDENRDPSNVICIGSQLKTSRDVLVHQGPKTPEALGTHPSEA
ncbi:hypothetical protein C4D60_Mb05t13330 [Musa balbisiana]|uniref:Uncharacterized protein n=1 Tax=Musa balbisiana TaxID=52838 RepID=A0A4S8JVV4_MUSBA|nr:hypothetical protein C4D60_Mb05t13330 [Musa balbisiana]